MKPSHPVSKSKLAQLAWMINKAIDNGNYDQPITEVRKAAEGGSVFQFVRDNLPSHRLLDFSLFGAEDVATVNDWFEQANGQHDSHVENKGLCLLLAWTIDMMQHAGDPDEVQEQT